MKNQIIKIALVAAFFLAFGGVVSAADVNLNIRDGANVVFSGTVAIPTSITSLNDAGGAPHPVDAGSVLAALSSASAQTGSNFSVSNLTYFSSFNSFYLKCITETSGGEKCDNWQYVVDGSTPSVGMDQNILSGGENIYVYFGPQYRVSLSANEITTAETLTVTAQEYNYQNNTWEIRTGVTVGLTQPDPNNPFSPTEIQAQAVDANGQAVFSSVFAGTYNVGIQQDFYFPTETFTVAAVPSSGGGGTWSGGGTVLSIPQKKVFNPQKAFEFLISQQKENGSLDEDIFTDWEIMAFASSPDYADKKDKLRKYLLENKLAGTVLTDLERHAMALMALGLNPYNTSGENYIKKINDSFDGAQFGDLNQDNDDIFALIVLQNAGYTQNEDIIQKTIAHILSKQKADGSWDESVDMTGAGMQALAFFNQEEQTKNGLSKAREFLKQNQKENGGWGNVSSTAWAMQGILALGEKPEDWTKNLPEGGAGGETPLDYLALHQDTDGGMKNENMQNKIWETSYVLTAFSGKTWNQIMQKFEKPPMPVAVEVPLKVAKEPEVKNIETNQITKAVFKKTKKIKLENLAAQNTAAPIMAVDDMSTKEKMPEPVQKRNWFIRFLASIFGF